MPVSSTTNRWEYTGDNATVDFTYNNKIFLTSELEVYSDNVLQTLTTDYTVSGAGVVTGGTVTYVTAPALDVKVVIRRIVADTQTTVYPTGGALPSGVIEDDIDRRTIVSQQQQEALDRAMLTPSGEDQVDMTLPVLATRASKYLGFDASGSPTELDAPAGTTAASTFGTSLIVAADPEGGQGVLNISTSVLTTGSSTVYVYTSTETLTTYDDGINLGVDFHATCGASPTINVDALGALSLKWSDGSDLAAGDVVTGQKALLSYDGTDMIVLTVSINRSDIQGQTYTAFDDSGAADAYVITPIPAIAAYAKNQVWCVDIANLNTTASTMNISALGVRNIFDYRTGVALVGGELLAGLNWFVDDGTQLILLTPASGWSRLNTQQATTSGTAKNFTGIPAAAKKITVLFVGVSTNGTAGVEVQLGDAGGFETSGYNGSIGDFITAGQTATVLSAGFTLTPVSVWTAAFLYHGTIVLTRGSSDGKTWMASINGGTSEAGLVATGGGSKTLTAILTQIRIHSVNDTDTFDAGAVNIVVEI